MDYNDFFLFISFFTLIPDCLYYECIFLFDYKFYLNSIIIFMSYFTI